MTLKSYLLSVPERIVRSTVGLGAGVARELGEVALPESVRRSQLYQNLVDATLRFLIEQVGGVEGVYGVEGTLPDNFLARRTAGNAVEVLGIVAFRASPVWILAALADLSGMGRQLIPEIADALKAQGLLDRDAQFTSVDQMLDGLERTSSRLAATINTPPLDVAGLRKDWEAIREEARRLPSASLPSRETIGRVWAQLEAESARQDRSVFETSSMMAISAVRALPDGVRWLSSSARVGAMRTGHIFAAALLDHYTQTLSEIQQAGYLAYAGRQFQPYVRAAVDQFSPKRRTLTQRLLEKVGSVRGLPQRRRHLQRGAGGSKQTVIAHRSMPKNSGMRDAQARPAPKCPECGECATEHPAGRCLDRWVHTAFLGRTVTLLEQPPPYSMVPQHPALEDVIKAPRWPEEFAVMQTSLGCTVGRRLSTSIGYEDYEIVAAADSLPLAVCRAAPCAADLGDKPLSIT